MRSITVVASLVVSLVGGVVPAFGEEQAPGSIRFEAAPGTVLRVEGHGRYSDTIAAVPAPQSGVQVINELSLDAYVEGLGEMPAHWPEEALKTQAVAARTYAWWEAVQGIWRDKGLDFDICATTACQVFHGREIIETPKVGKRWKAAVDATAGEVLMDGEWPILARFFSSSGGETRPNEHVFPEDGHRPYLRTVDDPEDRESSPLAHWRVVFTRDQMNQIFAHGQRLSTVAPFADIERVLSDGTRSDQIRVTGVNGDVVELVSWEFRQFVSAVAPQLFPGSFPQKRDDGGAMPATFPTSRMDFTVEDDRVVVDGYGWGHAVGMSQYGAKGKAEKGWTYDDILANYYGDIRPKVVDHSPERVRVGLSWDRGSFTVHADGPVTILRAGREATVDGGTWTVTAREDGSLALSGQDVAWKDRTTVSRRSPAPTPPASPPASQAGAQTERTERPDAVNAIGRVTNTVVTALEHASPVIVLMRLAFGR